MGQIFGLDFFFPLILPPAIPPVSPTFFSFDQPLLPDGETPMRDSSKQLIMSGQICGLGIQPSPIHFTLLMQHVSKEFTTVLLGDLQTRQSLSEKWNKM